MATPNITSQPNAAVNTSDKLLPQLLGVLAQNVGTQSGDTTTALQAILSAIQAKPSA